MVTNEEIDADHVSQPVGPSVKVEDEAQCCVGHLKVARWLKSVFFYGKISITLLELDLPPPHHSLAHYTQQFPFPLQPDEVNVTTQSQGFSMEPGALLRRGGGYISMKER